MSEDKCVRGDFSLGSKWDEMVLAMKQARYYLRLIPAEKRRIGVSTAIGILASALAYAETNNNEDYIKRICAEEPPPEYPGDSPKSTRT